MYSAFETVITTLTVRTGQLPGASWLPTEANRKYDAALAQLDGTVQRIVRDRTQRPGQEGEVGLRSLLRFRVLPHHTPQIS